MRLSEGAVMPVDSRRPSWADCGRDRQKMRASVRRAAVIMRVGLQCFL